MPVNTTSNNLCIKYDTTDSMANKNIEILNIKDFGP